MRYFFRFLILLGLVVFSTSAFANSNLKLLTESEYFSIYGYENISVPTLLEKLDFDYSQQFDVLFQENKQDPNALLGRNIDALYREVSDVLGILLTDYSGLLDVFENVDHLSGHMLDVLNALFSEPAYYYHDQKAIFISDEDITLGMLAHEMSHALISYYFVVPPPPRIQEVLSGYVEFKINKSNLGIRNDE